MWKHIQGKTFKKKIFKSSNDQPKAKTKNIKVSMESFETLATEPGVSTISSIDTSAVFREIYDCAKHNRRWEKVLSAIVANPEWLTTVPEGRQWTVLHQIVFCGDVSHLNEILASQINNENFLFLCKTNDNKTVYDIAIERANRYPLMLLCVKQLCSLDQLFLNAKEQKWDLVGENVRQYPNNINQKPPYQKYYLGHYLASIGELAVFKKLNDISPFRLDFKADNKTVLEIAHDNNHVAFAEHIQGLISINNQQPTISSSNETSHEPVFSPCPINLEYSDDEYNASSTISVAPINLNTTPYLTSFSQVVESLHNNPSSYNSICHTQTNFQVQSPSFLVLTSLNAHTHENKKIDKSNMLPPLTDKEELEYENIVINNLQGFPSGDLLNSIKCSITKAILRDPVVAADGFTYEREAIISWFEHSSRSPMTNQELDTLELKPNHAIKSILHVLSQKNQKN